MKNIYKFIDNCYKDPSLNKKLKEDAINYQKQLNKNHTKIYYTLVKDTRNSHIDKYNLHAKMYIKFFDGTHGKMVSVHYGTTNKYPEKWSEKNKEKAKEKLLKIIEKLMTNDKIKNK